LPQPQIIPVDERQHLLDLVRLALSWAREIQRRVREIKSGAVKTVSWSEARRRLLTLRDARTRS
jgi:hypothetical protein